MKVRLCGKRLYPTESVKYLGVKNDANLNWQCHVNDLSVKLIKTVWISILVPYLNKALF